MATEYIEKTKGDLLGESRTMRGRIDEAIMSEMQELGKSAILGLFLSIGGFFIFGVIFYFILVNIVARTRLLSLEALTLGNYFIIYIIIIGVLMIVSTRYVPKEQYYLGYHSKMRGLVDNPFTTRDNIDRGHIMLGFLMVIPSFILMNIRTLHDYITSSKPIKNSTLAAALLILAEESTHTEDMLETLQPLGFGKSAVQQAAGFLQKVDWVEAGKNKETGEPVLKLTQKGDGILKDARQYLK